MAIMRTLLLLIVVAAVACASDVKKVVETKVSYHNAPYTPSHTLPYVYHGQYPGEHLLRPLLN
jgi:hypothetical protein